MIYRLCDFTFPLAVASPLVVEIGFGDGRFWPAYCPTLSPAPSPNGQPAANATRPSYIGAELSGVSLLKAQARLKAAGLEQTPQSAAILTKLPAVVLMREVIAPRSVSQLIVNFPDPWPKAGHVEHRLLRQPFLTLAATRLCDDGCILFTTDHQEYFEFALQEAAHTGLFDIVQQPPPAAALQTKYALKWRDLGLPVYHARLSLRPNAALPDLPAHFRPYPTESAKKEEENVPHAILQDLPTPHLSKHTQHTPAWTVVLLDLYTRQRGGYVFLAHVVEGELTQEVLIETSPRADGTHLVRLTPFGGPVITAGIKAAVGVVTDWWAAQGAVVLRRGY